jgi:hypothetical protein
MTAPPPIGKTRFNEAPEGPNLSADYLSVETTVVTAQALVNISDFCHIRRDGFHLTDAYGGNEARLVWAHSPCRGADQPRQLARPQTLDTTGCPVWILCGVEGRS